MRTLLISLVAGALLLGCVSSGKYDGLKTKYDQAQSRINALQQGLDQDERQAVVLRARIAQNEQELAQSKVQLAQLAQQREEDAQRADGQSTALRNQLADVVKDSSRMKETTAQLRRALAELALNKQRADQRIVEFRGLLTRFKTLIDAGQLSVKIVDGRMVLALPTDVLFDSGSAKLSTAGKQTVLTVATVLSAMNDKRFQVEGHTDNVPISTARFPSNWELASARALVVLKQMVDGGMPKQVMSAASYGEFHPVTQNDNDAARAANRRIEIIVVPDLSTLPGSEELERAVSRAETP